LLISAGDQNYVTPSTDFNIKVKSILQLTNLTAQWQTDNCYAVLRSPLNPAWRRSIHFIHS